MLTGCHAARALLMLGLAGAGVLEEVLEQQKLLSDRVAAELRAVSCGVGVLVLVACSASVLRRLTTAHLNVRYSCTPVAHTPVNASSVLSSIQQQQ